MSTFMSSSLLLLLLLSSLSSLLLLLLLLLLCVNVEQSDLMRLGGDRPLLAEDLYELPPDFDVRITLLVFTCSYVANGTYVRVC
jgi:hypothetical protein